MGADRAHGGAFPVHAGMNRGLVRAVAGLTRVPRPRGDEPTIDTRLAVKLMRSPPTRG